MPSLCMQKACGRNGPPPRIEDVMDDTQPLYPGDRRFSLLPEEERSNKVRSLSARLFVGKWKEHAEAAAFLDEQVTAHGEGVDTLVRALLLYRDHMRGLTGTAATPSVDETELRAIVQAEIARLLGNGAAGG